MSVSSMTGFARVEGAHEDRRWVWELRSVNGRGLELRFRLPAGFDALEPELRRGASAAFTRGSLLATLTVEKAKGASSLRVDRAALDAALEAVDDIRARVDCGRPRAESILALRGVLVEEEAPADEARAAFFARLGASFEAALAALKKARQAEGAALAENLAGHADEIERLAGQARASDGASLAAIRSRIEAQLAELLAGAGIAEERLAQEAAMLAIKADIREELDRLDAHVEAARRLLAEGGAVGRRLDFLSQEFNREANTLCAKAQDMALKQLGLELKRVVDRMREQVQNIE